MTAEMDILVPVAAVLFFGIVSSIVYERGFNLHIFMASTAIGFSVLIYTGTLPSYFIVGAVLLMVGLLFSDSGDGV